MVTQNKIITAQLNIRTDWSNIYEGNQESILLVYNLHILFPGFKLLYPA